MSIHSPVRPREEVQQLHEHDSQVGLAPALLIPITTAVTTLRTKQQQILHLSRREHKVRQIQRDDGGLGREHGIGQQERGGLGVDQDVELGPLGPVPDAVDAVHLAHGRGREPAAHGPAHDAQAPDVGLELRVRQEQRRRVREGPRRHDPRRPRRRPPQRRRHRLYRRHARVGACLRRREKRRPVDPGLPVDVGWRVDRLAVLCCCGVNVLAGFVCVCVCRDGIKELKFLFFIKI